MNKLFNASRVIKPRSNAFDLSHEKKLSCNMGDLVPIYIEEVVPGDKFRVNTELFMRLAPMTFPVMHRVNVFTHFFFVPNRIIYSEWEDFITGGRTGNIVPPFPKIDWFSGAGNAMLHGTLADYLGLPTYGTVPQGANSSYVSALPFRAYQQIYNDYYRDNILQPEIDFDKSGLNPDAADLAKLVVLRKRAWEKDYYTSAQPNSQLGGEVMIPTEPNYRSQATTVNVDGTPGTGPLTSINGLLNDTDGGVTIENLNGMDISITDLRRSARLQEWLEKNARGGARYVEQILSHFGVRSSDARLQRAEYLGGGKQPITISEVLATFNSEETPLGAFAGHGVSVGKTNRFSKRFEEHGLIIGLLSTLPRTAYQQGLPKTFTKFDKFDYYWPEFANIGEQEILNKELYYDVADTANNEIFGYTPRYAEYKYKQSSVHGDFKESMNFTHMGRIFGTRPSLNESFIQADPTHRIFAVDDPAVHKLWVQLYNDVKAIRPMPQFGTPTL